MLLPASWHPIVHTLSYGALDAGALRMNPRAQKDGWRQEDELEKANKLTVSIIHLNRVLK